MTHPYSGIQDYRRWRLAVAGMQPRGLDPVVRFPFAISLEHKIAVAGSCFAQHVVRHLRSHGFHFFDVEPAHPLLPADTAAEFGYGQFSARFGNIYTSRQLLQLLRRAYGRFLPAEDVWMESGRYFDPFRPAIQPNGFATRQEYEADRGQHFSAVRRMFEHADVFIFTLGLTECWISRTDGAVFPLCPGTAVGQFDLLRHAFLNLAVEDVVADMTSFLVELRALNPGIKVVLTVSPVPLVATALDRHVLVSNTASKAVLRAAVERLTELSGVAYFPSYEIITNPSARGSYFAEDLRSIREEGVRHVMDLFFKHVGASATEQMPPSSEPAPDPFRTAMQNVVDTMCDELQLDS